MLNGMLKIFSSFFYGNYHFPPNNILLSNVYKYAHAAGLYYFYLNH